MYNELRRICQIPGAARIRYARLLGLLRRICIEQAADFKGDYATLFSLLMAVCQAKGIDHRAADRFRHRAGLVLHGEAEPTAEEELADVADLCHFVRQLTGNPIPADLPQHIRPLRILPPQMQGRKCLRGLIKEVVSRHEFKCALEDSPIEYTVRFAEQKDTLPENFQATAYLYAGANVMLLDVEAERECADTLRIYMAVLEPDYLIDVSALTATLKPYGNSPLNYLINRLAPNATTKHILLGNMANQFMDDCINGDDSPELYSHSLQKNYRQNLLEFACMDDEEISPDFFVQAKLHFTNIQRSVRQTFGAQDVDIDPAKVLLEPSFICPTLGLRGRLDVMTMDFLRVLELKSGKAQEHYGKVIGPKPDHLLQMTLYGEILRRNFGIAWNEVRTFLFYSAYPYIYNERPSAAAIREILNQRNGIIRLTHLLREGRFEDLLPLLTAEHLNENRLSGRFFENYLRPQIEAVTLPLQALRKDDLLRAYVSAFITFVEREQFMSKTSDNRPDSIRGFAATWTADLRTKLLAGNILTGLRIARTETDAEGGVAVVHFSLPAYGDAFVPNFNMGEMVQIYEASTPQANVTNRQLLRGTVTHLSAETLTVAMAYKQRNLQLFSAEKDYTVEHDATDAPFAQQLRNLFALLDATPRRRDLLLGRRMPEVDLAQGLVGEYTGDVKEIVLKAKQARDYFLLVGPPGTGKTNMALRSMVKEFLLSSAATGSTPLGEPASPASFRHDALMLTAYTNRAVDEICSMLDGLAREIPFDYLRIGTPQNCAGAYHPHLLCERAEKLGNRNEVRHMLDRIPIVVGTVLTLTNRQILFRRKRFEAAIIDEASQLLEPQALGLFCAQAGGVDAIGKFILIGDHKQLPAVVMLPEKQTRVSHPLLREIGLTDLRNSLFERLHKLEIRQNRKQFVGMLSRQGRMHPDICRFVNACFYEGKLSAVPLPHQKETLHWQRADTACERFVASTRMGFVPVRQKKHAENLRANAPEAEAVCRIVEALCSLHEKNGAEGFVPERSIGVIVPFRSQIASIRACLRERGHDWAERLTIDTVECYQGSQRDYILYSTTISEPYQLQILSAVQRVGEAEVDRKLNVAITRARRQFFMFGDPDLLSLSPVYRALLAACTPMPQEE